MKEGRLRVAALGGLCGLLYLLLLGSALGTVGWVRTLEAERNELGRRQAALERAVGALAIREKALSDALDELDRTLPAPAPDGMAFYSEVQRGLQEAGAEVLAAQWAPGEEGRSVLVMKLRGSCDALLQALALWREIPMAARVSALTLNAPEPSGFVEANVTLEALVASPEGR